MVHVQKFQSKRNNYPAVNGKQHRIKRTTIQVCYYYIGWCDMLIKIKSEIQNRIRLHGCKTTVTAECFITPWDTTKTCGILNSYVISILGHYLRLQRSPSFKPDLGLIYGDLISDV